MRPRNLLQPTIGFLSTWSVYEGTAIDGYTHTLLRGMCAAAADLQANLLIGCGISLPGSPRGSRTVWPVPSERADFVPVGPWNCDGLVIIPDDLSDEQYDYVQDLIRSGFPILLTTAEKSGPLIAVDNRRGILEAFEHLYQHGHRRIAFIAGKSGRGGDSAERLAAFRSSLAQAGLEADERLIAFGEHRREDGRLAMQQILEREVDFTAVIASNDLSALGAMEVLRAAGRRIPEDVAVIGFDDILEARSHLPPLTTVRHPTFSLGYQAMVSILQTIRGETPRAGNQRVATRLVIRQSCGCRPDCAPAETPFTSCPLESESAGLALEAWMEEIVALETHHSRPEEVRSRCQGITESLIGSLGDGDISRFDTQLRELYRWLETRPEDSEAWLSVFTTLRNRPPGSLPALPAARPGFLRELLDYACLGLADLIRRQTTGALLKQISASNRLGLMTSQLLASTDITRSGEILEQHLPLLGIHQALVGLYSQDDEDPRFTAEVLLSFGFGRQVDGARFLTRQFPPAEWFPPGETFQLAVLPLVIDGQAAGFAAFSAGNLEPCAAVVHNLASALRSSRLYQQALQGRTLAEEANRLKSRFLSIVSHELRTPLSLIVGLSDMVLREGGEMPEASKRDLEQIHTSAQHLARLIGDVLDLASSEAGQLRILREPLDLSEVLRITARIGEQLAREKGLEWDAHFPLSGPWVLGDRTRLNQVILNLVSNAVKFTPHGRIRLEVSVTAREVTVAISDTGIGISPMEQETVFKEFRRSERLVQSGLGGMGLGLTISRQLIEKHGGSLGVRSPGDLGSGSTFFFTLPVLTAPGWKEDLEPPHPLPRHAVILLTEEAGGAEPLRARLQEQNFEVLVCPIQQDTDWLLRLAELRPAAFILDAQLAAREGWAITSLFKRQPAAAGIPVFAFSLDTSNDRGELVELNYLHKPLQPDQLAAELSRLNRAPGEHGAAVKTVLLVDDDPGMLGLHRRLVEQAGYQALTAQSGSEALEKLETVLPDLILLDLMMPEMDGFEVLAALHSREATRDIPVIILTARMLSEADLERCSRGVTAILTKGLFSAEETLDHIEAALLRQETLSGPTQRLVRQAMAWIHTHYAEPITRDEIARSVGISPDYLTDCFRQEMAVTPITYLRRYRIRQACELLKNSDLSITQVAMAVGFSESAHFSRTFHREIGLTPRAYRRMSQGREAGEPELRDS